MQENSIQDESNIIDSPPLWVIRYKAPLIAGVLLVLAAAIGYASWQMRKSVQEDVARTELEAAATVDSRLQIARKFLGTDVAGLALLSVASEQYEKKDYAGSIETYALFLSHYSHHRLTNLARLGQAWAFDASGKTDEALAGFAAVGFRSPADNYNPVGLLEAARLYKGKKDYAAARQALNDCIRAYGSTIYGQQAAEKLKEVPAS